MKKRSSLNFKFTLNNDNPDVTAILDCGRNRELQRAEAIANRGSPKAGALAESLTALAAAQAMAGDLRSACTSCKRALQVNSRNPDYHAHLGSVQFALGNLVDAKRSLRMARRLGRHNETDYYMLCVCLMRLGEHKAAIEAAGSLVSAWPTSAQNVGLYAEALKRLDTPDAEATALKAAATSCISAERIERALEWLRRAQALAPHDGTLWSLASAAHRTAGSYDKAEQCVQKAIGLGETSWRTRNILGLIMQETCRPAEAYQEFRKATELESSDPMLIGNAVMAMHYAPDATAEDIRAEIDSHAKSISRDITQSRRRHRPNVSKPLRVGLLSGTFHRHPTLYLSLAGLEKVDRLNVQFFVYSNGGRRDEFTNRLKEISSVWRDISGASDDNVAKVIRADDLDILIDMAGTNQGRPAVVARTPAPVQAKWVGGLYNTTGMEAIDWLLADTVEVPAAEEFRFSENIYRLPDGYVVYEPPEYAAPVASSPFIANQHITFCSFNNPAKVNEVIVGLWSEILRKLPDSRLRLKGRGFTSSNARERVRGWFESHGIRADRISMEPASPHADLMESYNHCDIALDTWPYSGGLTTCEALWMGNPVVTLPGPTFAGRHSASHLTNIGRTEWIACSDAEYIEKTVTLASDRDALRAIRQSLRQEVAASPLCNAERFARNLETALLDMSRSAEAAGQRPRGPRIPVNLT